MNNNVSTETLMILVVALLISIMAITTISIVLLAKFYEFTRKDHKSLVKPHKFNKFKWCSSGRDQILYKAV